MANLDDLLEKTSRTFALAIPLLPEPTRREVSVAYLLFRIADTFEDAELWTPEERRKALGDFSQLLAGRVGGAESPRERVLSRDSLHFSARREPDDFATPRVASGKRESRPTPPAPEQATPEAGRGVTGDGYLPPARWSGNPPRQATAVEGSTDSRKVAPGRTPRPASEISREALAKAWTAAPPCRHAGYLELLRETPSVLADFESLSPPAREIVGRHVARSAEGMAAFVSRMSPQGNLVLADLADLRSYCYAVAGIVGEMLTELFLLRGGLSAIEGRLRERAPLFGEGLQLVNILKDSFSDLKDGRRYLPPGVERREVFALARNDLARAGEYVLDLQKSGAPRGLVGFTALPVELAWASLDRIEKDGAGAKVTRPEVYFIAKRLERALDRNEPAIFSISCGGGAS